MPSRGGLNRIATSGPASVFLTTDKGNGTSALIHPDAPTPAEVAVDVEADSAALAAEQIRQDAVDEAERKEVEAWGDEETPTASEQKRGGVI